MKFLQILVFTILSASCVTSNIENSVGSASVVLQVSAITVEHTEHSTADCEYPDCISLSYWSVYKAKVNRVIKGSFPYRNVYFASAQHAPYNDRALENWYVSLVLVENNENSKLFPHPYVVVDHAFSWDNDLSEWINEHLSVDA